MGVRRVVTAKNDQGKSVVVSDEIVEPITVTLLGEGGGFTGLWGADGPVDLASAGSPTRTAGWFPPRGGFRFALISFAPEAPLPPDLDLEAAIGELAAKVPGLVETLEPDNPVMHTTDTVDFSYVVSGEVWLELDDGVETLLRAGDCVVQNGARHAWHNRSSAPCLVVVGMVGATRSAVATPVANGSVR
jgi:mannose-6-phosphate isomerase-like protein (cupin superfamily)